MGVPTFGAIILDETLDNVCICIQLLEASYTDLKESCRNLHIFLYILIHGLFWPEGVDGPGLSGQVWLGFS